MRLEWFIRYFDVLFLIASKFSFIENQTSMLKPGFEYKTWEISLAWQGFTRALKRICYWLALINVVKVGDLTQFMSDSVRRQELIIHFGVKCHVRNEDCKKVNKEVYIFFVISFSGYKFSVFVKNGWGVSIQLIFSFLVCNISYTLRSEYKFKN